VRRALKSLPVDSPKIEPERVDPPPEDVRT